MKSPSFTASHVDLLYPLGNHRVYEEDIHEEIQFLVLSASVRCSIPSSAIRWFLWETTSEQEPQSGIRNILYSVRAVCISR